MARLSVAAKTPIIVHNICNYCSQIPIIVLIFFHKWHLIAWLLPSVNAQSTCWLAMNSKMILLFHVWISLSKDTWHSNVNLSHWHLTKRRKCIQALQSWCCWQFWCEIFCVEICKNCWFGKVWTAVNICRYPNLTNPSVIPKCLFPLSKILLNKRIVTTLYFIHVCFAYHLFLFRNKGWNWFMFVYLYVLCLIHSTYHRFLLVYAPVASD